MPSPITLPKESITIMSFAKRLALAAGLLIDLLISATAAGSYATQSHAGTGTEMAVFALAFIVIAVAGVVLLVIAKRQEATSA